MEDWLGKAMKNSTNEKFIQALRARALEQFFEINRDALAQFQNAMKADPEAPPRATPPSEGGSIGG